MNCNIPTKVSTPVFKPQEITLTIETVEEARSLYHVFNHCNFRKSLLVEVNGVPNYYGICGFKYSRELSDLNCEKARVALKDSIESQGFEV